MTEGDSALQRARKVPSEREYGVAAPQPTIILLKESVREVDGLALYKRLPCRVVRYHVVSRGGCCRRRGGVEEGGEEEAGVREMLCRVKTRPFLPRA